MWPQCVCTRVGCFVICVVVVGAVGIVFCGFVGFRRGLGGGGAAGDIVEEEMESWFNALLSCPVSCVTQTMPCRAKGRRDISRVNSRHLMASSGEFLDVSPAHSWPG